MRSPKWSEVRNPLTTSEFFRFLMPKPRRKKLTIQKTMGLSAAIVIILLGLQCVAFAEERLSVSASIANMRSGPGTKYDVLWQVEQYHPFKIVEKKGEWYRVNDFENDEAWLHKTLLDKIESVITKKEKCNVRSKPATTGSILFSVERGVPFKVLGKEENWIKIEHADGDVGWIYKTLVW